MGKTNNKEKIEILTFDTPLDSYCIGSGDGYVSYVNIEAVTTNKGGMWYVAITRDVYSGGNFQYTETRQSSLFSNEDDAWGYYDWYMSGKQDDTGEVK